MRGNRSKAQARAPTGAAARAAVAKRTELSASEEAAAEVAAAEGATDAAAEARAPPPTKSARPATKPASATPPEPTSRQKANEQAKEKEMFKTLQDECKKLSDKLKQAEMEKAQLQEVQRAKSGRRASQDQKPAKSNSKRRIEKVCVETDHIDRNIQSFDAVWKPCCISPAGYQPITKQLVYYLTTLFFSVDI